MHAFDVVRELDVGFHLQHARGEQRLDLRLGDRRDVVKPGLRQVLDLAAFDRGASIAA
jgi:hypothetical protein